MAYFLSKLVGFLLLPSNFIAISGVLGIVALAVGRRRAAAALLALTAALLAVVGWTPVGPIALMLLEERFPPPDIRAPVAGVVMLGGAVDAHVTVERDAVTLNEAAERITAVAELSRRFPEARILLSGGGGALNGPRPLTESALARDILTALGVPADRIELEERSRTTCENAGESLIAARPAADERWLLVTSANHMPRAIACFRAVDFAVVPYPVDYRTRGPAGAWRPVPSVAQGLSAADAAAHEWLGLAAYRLFGRTDELFPAP